MSHPAVCCLEKTIEVDSMGYEMDVLDLRPFRRRRLSRTVAFNPYKTI